MFRGIENVTIAVKDIEAAIAQYNVVLGREPNTRGTNGTMQTAWYDLDHSSIELVQDDDPNSTVGRFMTRTGGGLYYVALHTDDPTETVADLRAKEVRLFGDPGDGVKIYNEAFVHPAAASGVLIRILPVGYREAHRAAYQAGQGAEEAR